jgi:hypothetical protein
MTAPRYNWKRNWVPRDGEFSFDSQGFLLSPARESEWAKCWKTDVLGFNELLDKRCLVLLGEPGIGKSHAIRDAKERTQARPGEIEPIVLFRDLSCYNSDQRLVEDVFNSSEFDAWRKGRGELHVLLDSFDECLLRVDSVADILADQFARLPSIQKLYLRIASRTAEWRTQLEDALRDRWGKDSLGVFELAPLTRDQVVSAAIVQQVEAEKFIAAAFGSEVVPFAIKPLTLELLFNVWKKRGGALPPTQREIYEEGCLELCRDSEKRQTPKLRGQFSADERLAVAAHIAAATFFCNRAAVWTGGSHAHKPESDLSISELATGHVTAKRQRLAVSEAAVREALNTGLFWSRGRNRLCWAHQTYGEFLAARYLTQEGLTTRQVLDLVAHPHDADRKLVPQLQEAAAWAVAPGSELFVHLARIQPEVLLRSDVATADAKHKSTLVDALMLAFAQDAVQGDWWAMRKRYSKLKHPQLARQLRCFLSDRNYAANARVEAVSMAEACGVSELLPLLATLALDEKESASVRAWAAAIVARSSDARQKERLRPLALGRVGADERNALRGSGLTACWPGHLSVDELFSSLTEPDERFHGIYDAFLRDKLVQKLTATDYPKALAWAESQAEHGRSFDGGYAGLVTRILDGAAEHIEATGVMAALANALLSRLRKHDFLHGARSSRLIDMLESRPDLRLRLVSAMVQCFEEDRNDSLMITRGGTRLVFPKEIPWLIERIRSAPSAAMQGRYAHLLSWVFYPDDAARIDAVIEAAEACPVLVEVMPHWLEPMALNSNEARKARDLHFDEQHHREAKEEHRIPKLLSPPPSERLISLLDQFEFGDLSAWWRLFLCLEVKDDGRWCEKHYHMDIRELVGWQSASDATKARLIAAAERYLLHCDSNPDEWFSRRNFKYHPAVAGFRALLLLANLRPTVCEALPRAVWQRWLPAILRLHHYDDRDDHQLLTAKTFSLVPVETTDWTLRVIEEENLEGDNLWILQKLPDKWHPVLGPALLRRLRRGRLKPLCYEQLLTALLEQRVPGALDFARSRIPSRVPTNCNRRRIALHVARLLMRHGDRDDWPRVWKLIGADATFGMALMEGFTHDVGRSPAAILKTLTETDVGKLWEWMLVQYPIQEDPDRSRGGEVTTRYRMADLRDSLVSYLADIGTAPGSAEVRRLISRYPQFEWFRRVLLRSQEQIRRLTWQPPVPAILFQLAESNRSRLVQSGGQLLEVVIESLGVLQSRLQGESLMARFLWNESKPRPEEDLSEWIKAELESDLKGRGVVLGREVQIHRFDRTDIHITAVTNSSRTDSLDSVKVIIEVKGDWHRELHSAMGSQLANRYLQENDCRHGLYLVGWFRRVSRIIRFEKQSLSKLRDRLTSQAKSLTNGERKIAAFVLDCSIPVPARNKRPLSKE